MSILKNRGKNFQKVDKTITRWMARHAITFIRVSIGILFFWFGFLKFFPGLSPAEEIAIKTINTLTFELFSQQVIITGLAILESFIGVALIFKLFLRETLLLLFIQMIGTITPVFLFPEDVFTVFPYGLTLEGQYIFKNLIIFSGAIAVGATVRGGRIKPE
jgi:uncharacterized membrane protein YkgB